MYVNRQVFFPIQGYSRSLFQVSPVGRAALFRVRFFIPTSRLALRLGLSGNGDLIRFPSGLFFRGAVIVNVSLRLGDDA